MIMEAVFLKLLNMSITAGWIVLAVVLLRLLLKKAPKWISCLLWVLVGLRLILPFSFESKMSVVPSAETVPQEIIYSPAPTINSGIPFVNSTVNPIVSESLTPAPGASANPIQIVIFIATIIWCIGIAGMLIYALISYLRVRYKVRFSAPLQENIHICDHIDTPFILGLIKPKIYLPSSLEEKEAEHVIAHEKSHLKRFDHLWKPLGFALLTVYWFNPLLWLGYVLLCRDIELACDERVIKDMDTEEKKAYSTALLDCSIPRRMISACPLAFGEVNVKNRIKNVLNYKKPAFWIIIIAIAACIVAAVCLLTDPKKEADAEEVIIPDVSLSDIADMNIGTDIPFIIYADDNVMYFSGTFGLIIYDYNSMTVLDRVAAEETEGCGFTLTWASADGGTVYFERFNEPPCYKYDVKNKNLLPCDGADSSQHFDREHLTEEQRKLLNDFYINGDGVVNTDEGFYYLRSDDWNMKNLQLVFHDNESGIDDAYYIFDDTSSYICVILTYHDSVDFLEPTLTIVPKNQHFQFVWSGFSSYIAQGKYSFEGDSLVLRTDDGLYTYVFETCEEGYRFDADRSSKIPEYRYSADSYDTECPVPDGALFEGDIAKASFVPRPPITLTETKIPNTSDWKTTGLESIGLSGAEISHTMDYSADSTLYFLTVHTVSDTRRDLFIALERKDDVLIYPISEMCSLISCEVADVDGDKSFEIVMLVDNGGVWSHTAYVLKVESYRITPLFEKNLYIHPFEEGFSYTLRAPFELLVTNSITGYSTVIDFSDREEYIGEVFDEKGNPLGKWEAKHDCFRTFTPKDVDNDGVYEIIGSMHTHLYSHADGIGDSECTLRYNKDSGEFEVIDARFVKYADSRAIASGDYYTVTDMGNFTYDYDIVNRSGTILLSDYGLTKKPKIKMISDSVVRRDISGGTGKLCINTVYCDVRTDKVSENFTGVWGEYGNKVLYESYEDGVHNIIIQDIFDKDVYYRKIPITKEYIATEVITDVDFSEDGVATILYYSDNDYNQSVIRIDLTASEDDLACFVVPIDFDMEGHVYIWESGKCFTSLHSHSSGYDYVIQDINGNIVLEDHNMERWPNFHMVNDSVLCMYIQYGTGLLTRNTVYVNVKTGEISPVYGCAFSDEIKGAAYGEYGNNVIYLSLKNDCHYMVVRDIFDEKKYYKEVLLTDDKDAPLENICSWDISPDGMATFTFVADGNLTEKTIKIDMTTP